MASWQYRCKSCGQMHETLLRPGGSAYLRCAITHAWAWYEASIFTAPAETARRGSGVAAAGLRLAARRGGARIARRSARSEHGAAARKTATRKPVRSARKPARSAKKRR